MAKYFHICDECGKTISDFTTDEEETHTIIAENRKGIPSYEQQYYCPKCFVNVNREFIKNKAKSLSKNTA